MDPISAGIAMGGIGAIGGYFSGKSAEKQTEATNAMNLRIAQEQMAFQERMANTAHQREAADYEAAGLNRILTATGGSGAAAPSGSAPTMMMNPKAGFVGDALAMGATSAMSAANIAADLDTKNANVAKTLAETSNALEQNKVISEDVRGRRASNAKSEATLDWDVNRAKSESSRAAWESTRAMYERDRAETQSQKEKYDLPRAKAESDADRDYMRYNKTLDLLQNGIDAATSAINIRKVFQPPTVRPGSPQERRALERAGRKGLEVK